MSRLPRIALPDEDPKDHPLVTEAIRLAALDDYIDTAAQAVTDALRHRDDAIVDAWNAGLSESYLSKRFGLDRRRIHRALVEGAQSGELTRPLAAPRTR